MASITSLGAGSGLPLESLLSQLMVAESIPLKTLQTRQSSYQTKISAIGTVTSKLSALQTAANDMMAGTATDPTNKFATYAATVGDTTVASATASTGATAGNYSLEVTQLATGAKMTSSAVASSTTSITSSAASLTLNYGGTPYSVNLAANATLANLRDAINNGGSGVTATIITGTAAGDGAHLVLTGATGAKNTIAMDLSSLTGLSGPMSLATTKAPQDASIKLDGIVATSSSNSVTSALDGVTINLTATTTSATTLTVAKSVTDKLTSTLNTFVSAYNAAYSNLSTLTAYNSDTKTAGTLQGNGTMRSVMSQLSKLLTSTTSGSSTSAYQTLSDIGVSIQDDGTLKVDSSRLNAALAADQKTVASLVSNVGTAFSGIVDKMTGTSGNITSETKSLNNIVSNFTDQQDRLQLRLDSIQARYRAQFTALDTMVSNLKTTSSYISSYLSTLNSSSSSSSTG